MALKLEVPSEALLHGLRWGARWYWMVQLLASRVFLVIGSTLDHPVPGFEGFLAARQVALGEEGLLVVGDATQVLTTGVDRCCHGGETGTSHRLIRGDRRRAFSLLAQIDAVTVGVLRRGDAVRAQEHFAASVLAVLARL